MRCGGDWANPRKRRSQVREPHDQGQARVGRRIEQGGGFRGAFAYAGPKPIDTGANRSFSLSPAASAPAAATAATAATPPPANAAYPKADATAAAAPVTAAPAAVAPAAVMAASAAAMPTVTAAAMAAVTAVTDQLYA